MEWQTYIALGVVAVTLAIFIHSIFFRKKSKTSCGHDCGCGSNKKP